MYKTVAILLIAIALGGCYLPYWWLLPEPATDLPQPTPTPAVAPFTADFLNLRDDEQDQFTILKQSLGDRYGWQVDDLTLADFDGADFNLFDPTAMGQVLVLISGNELLTSEALSAIQTYVSDGGNLVILGGIDVASPETALATDNNLNDWLNQDFGLRFNNDLLIDKTQAFQSPLIPVSTDLNAQHFITSNGIPARQGAIIFETPNTITIAEQPPESVTVTWLAKSTAAAYTKTDIESVLANDIDKAEADPHGPFIVAAAAENTETGARIILLGSTSLATDTYGEFQNIDNLSVAFNSIIWAPRFDEYFHALHVTPEPTPSR